MKAPPDTTRHVTIDPLLCSGCSRTRRPWSATGGAAEARWGAEASAVAAGGALWPKGFPGLGAH